MKCIVTLILILFLMMGCSKNAYNIDPNTTSNSGNSEEKLVVTKTEQVKECVEKWSCTDWEPEECPKTESQTRSCTDSNRCGTTKNKPSQRQSCTYEESEFCPQFVKLEHSNPEILWYNHYQYDGVVNVVDGWEIGGGWEAWEGDYTYCRKGSKAGENINYNYCGEGQKYYNNELFIRKVITDPSGVIKETFTKDIIIITDSEGKFVETICK